MVNAKKDSLRDAHPAASWHPSEEEPTPFRLRPVLPDYSSGAEPVRAIVFTDDDVNYYDDDGLNRQYVYDDFVYIYPHDDNAYHPYSPTGNHPISHHVVDCH